MSNDRDYVSPGLAVVTPDAAFPRMRVGDRWTHPWKFLRREVPHRWCADERFPLMGFINRDEAAILHNLALGLAGKPALEIGSWLGWSTCHLALGGVEVDSIDPAHDEAAFRVIVEESLAHCGVADRVHLNGGRSPDAIAELAARRQVKWSLFFIDGDHEAPAPLRDAQACLPHAASDCVFVFHDLVSPAVAEGLRFLQDHGFKVLLYQTAQIMGIAWRGRVVPVGHVPDPLVQWQLPHHLVGLPVAGVDFGARPRAPLSFRELREQAYGGPGDARPATCIVSSEIIGLFKNGGIGTSMTGLAERLAAQGFPVTILYTGAGAKAGPELTRWQRRYAELGITLVALNPDGVNPVAGPLGEHGYTVPYLVYRYLAANRFDVIHFNDCLGEAYLCLAAKRLGIGFAGSLLVVALHSPSQWVLELNQILPTNRIYAAYNFAERLSVECADVLWSPSRYLLDWARDRGFVLPQRTFVQQYVLPTQRLREEDVEEAVAGTAVKGCRAAPAREVVFFGRLEERKGLRLFCNAIDLLRDELADRHIAVTFLGKVQTCAGMDSADYIAQRSARWKFPIATLSDLGQPEALAYLRAGARLAVMPSPADNSPCTVYEALAWGIPFLAARTGGIPELIADADEPHVLFDYATESLRDALSDALERGGWIARPSVAQVEALRSWAAFHGGWHELLPDHTPDNERRGLVAIVDHHAGDDLAATLETLSACAELVRAIVLNRTDDAPPVTAGGLAVHNMALLVQDPAALRAELPRLAGGEVLLIHSGTRVRPAGLLAMMDALGRSGVDGLVPAAEVGGSPSRVVAPLGGSACFSLFEGVTFTGGLLVRGELLARASGGLALGDAFLGLADECVAGGAKIWPFAETVFERTDDRRALGRGALPARVALYAEAPPGERYYMLAGAFPGPNASPDAIGQALAVRAGARRLTAVGFQRVVRLGSWSLSHAPGVKAGLKKTRAFRLLQRIRDRLAAEPTA